MAKSVNLDADRWVPFSRTLAVTGVDLTGASLCAEARLYGNAPGAAPISLAVGTGVTLLSVETVGDVPVSNLRFDFGTPGDAVPLGGVPSADLSIVWGLIVRLPGRDWQSWLHGDFNILAGVTRNG